MTRAGAPPSGTAVSRTLCGSGARRRDAPRAPATLTARPVNWHDTARLAWERGARLAVEMPSGTVLTGLPKSAFADGLAVCSENNRIETLISLITRQ